jgi:hypothetical protein
MLIKLIMKNHWPRSTREAYCFRYSMTYRDFSISDCLEITRKEAKLNTRTMKTPDSSAIQRMEHHLGGRKVPEVTERVGEVFDPMIGVVKSRVPPASRAVGAEFTLPVAK